jgi:hypothetical protein
VPYQRVRNPPACTSASCMREAEVSQAAADNDGIKQGAVMEGQNSSRSTYLVYYVTNCIPSTYVVHTYSKGLVHVAGAALRRSSLRLASLGKGGSGDLQIIVLSLALVTPSEPPPANRRSLDSRLVDFYSITQKLRLRVCSRLMILRDTYIASPSSASFGMLNSVSFELS